MTRDKRIKVICLFDFVDNIVYVLFGVGYFSVLVVMKVNLFVVLFVVIVGGVNGGECVFAELNFVEFFVVSSSGVVARDYLFWGILCGVGYFDFVDEVMFV